MVGVTALSGFAVLSVDLLTPLSYDVDLLRSTDFLVRPVKVVFEGLAGLVTTFSLLALFLDLFLLVASLDEVVDLLRLRV